MTAHIERESGTTERRVLESQLGLAVGWVAPARQLLPLDSQLRLPGWPCWSPTRLGVTGRPRPCFEWIGLALQFEEPVVERRSFETDSVNDGLADHNLTSRSFGAEPGHGVCCVPEDGEIARSWLAHHSDIGDSCMNAGTRRVAMSFLHRAGDVPGDIDCRVQCIERVLLSYERRYPHGHHTVPGHVIDDSVLGVYIVAHDSQIAPYPFGERTRIGLLCELGGAAYVYVDERYGYLSSTAVLLQVSNAHLADLLIQRPPPESK